MEDKNKWTLGERDRPGARRDREKAVLVAVIRPSQTTELVEEHLDELEFLAATAGARSVKRFVQKLDHLEPRTYIRKGKVEEIAEYLEDRNIDMVIFDDDLTGKQTVTLEELLKVKIIDRSSLILDIFAKRAKTAQAKTQVELAQMQYLLPRLRGLWTHLERQRGGIGMRGPGEQEIETDRRIVRGKISLLQKKLEKIAQQDQTRRKNRGQLVRVALVGYTNVGKSTLMNVLCKSDVFAENKLFATVDTTVRKVVLDRMPFLLSDTVGFIRKLPHHLIESFKSTLDEVRESDVLLHVVDLAHPNYEDHISTVNSTLRDIGVEDKHTIMVFNKVDAYRKKYFDELIDPETKSDIEAEFIESLKTRYEDDVVVISAANKENLSELRELLKIRVMSAYHERYPYQVRQW